MTKKDKLDLDERRKEAPARCLRQAAKSYLATAIQNYLDIEGQISVWSQERFGRSAVVICSLNRAVEHLLKLRLLKLDPLLLYPWPKKIEDYCRIRGIPLPDNQSSAQRREERELLAHTVPFKEALARVKSTLAHTSFDFKHFRQIYALRNSLEHHWDRNEVLLQKVVGTLSSKTIPTLQKFITDVLEERVEDYFDRRLLEEVQRLDRAIAERHSLQLQRRLEEHRQLYVRDVELARRKSPYPDRYIGLQEQETEVACPVCGEPFIALWDWEVDYDVEGSSGEWYISGIFPDAKSLHCPNCHFYIEGEDIETYLPEGLEIEFEADWDDYYQAM